MTINRETLQWALTQEAARQKISNTRIAEAVGVSRDTVSRWKKGKGEPTFEQIQRLADLLNLAPEGFFC